MSQSRYTLRGAGSSRSLRRRIVRRGVAGSVLHPKRRQLFALQRIRWQYEAMLAEIKREEAMELLEAGGFDVDE